MPQLSETAVQTEAAEEEAEEPAAEEAAAEEEGKACCVSTDNTKRTSV